jgi:hypothetical protein
MNADNIDETFPVERRTRILKELQKRGRFFLLARDMLAHARQKYSNESLKKQLDVAEHDIEAMNEKLAKMQKTIKKNFIHLRELLPAHFDETYEQVCAVYSINVLLSFLRTVICSMCTHLPSFLCFLAASYQQQITTAAGPAGPCGGVRRLPRADGRGAASVGQIKRPA